MTLLYEEYIMEKKRLFNVLACFFLILASELCFGGTSAMSQSAQMCFESPSHDTHFTFDERTATYLSNIVQNWLVGIRERNPYILEMFKSENKEKNGNLLPWSGEFAGKYLTAATEMLVLTHNQKLHDYVQTFVNDLIALQEDNGYLGPWPKEYQLTGKMPGGGVTWDAWNHYHIMIGLIKWFQYSGDQAALKAAAKIGDLFYETFYENPEKILGRNQIGWGNGSMEFNLTCAHSCVELYRIIPDVRYLDLSNYIIEEILPQYGDYIELGLRNKPFFTARGKDAARWERLHILMALPDLYIVQKNDKYQKSFENLWWSITEHDCHNTLAFSTYEAAQGNPYGIGPIETCCVVAWNAMSVDMLKLTGNSVVADVIEMTHYNALRASQDISGQWSTYHTGTEGLRLSNVKEIGWQARPGSEELNCCSVNAARGCGLISEWALMKDNKGLILNWYGQSEFSTEFNKTKVVIRQRTNYPRDGKIVIDISPEKEMRFELKLRIPFWSDNSSIKVNSEKRNSAVAGQYYTLSRTWKHNDQIELLLDMNLAYWPGQREQSGDASFYYGPLLLAYNPPQVNLPQMEGGWATYGRLFTSNVPGSKLTFQVSGDQVSILFYKCPQVYNVSVTIDDQKPKVIDLYDPEWNVPYSVDFDGLGEGIHKVTITVLEKSEKSPPKGWNVAKIQFKTCDLPIFDMQNFQWHVTDLKDAELVRIECTDRHGQKVVMTDFDSAGWNRQYYASWMPVLNSSKSDFSKSNPLRLIRIQNWK